VADLEPAPLDNLGHAIGDAQMDIERNLRPTLELASPPPGTRHSTIASIISSPSMTSASPSSVRHPEWSSAVCIRVTLPESDADLLTYADWIKDEVLAVWLDTDPTSTEPIIAKA
jgi:hypothetical protein